ncbi:recombinase family protein [Spirosoma utsteinense]|uniref:recombinase family protein n=1 Tax=Spirosoma utsteinense TaxID=2585773 RepID=UPI00164550B3|nr:recombinase family protein [Spirosoma utsteinense]MBC3789080.1 DNA invertase Pin-like site-specific DNA recombinase [Spirosoma utsteinense]
MVKYVAYYRVSTQKQGRSGLGLDAQKAGIESFCGEQLIGNFIEIESGGKTSRKELASAIKLCQKENAKLIAYRLDRVLRNLEILVALRTNKVPFTALDCLNDSDMIINIKAALAEDELRKISERTRAALAQKKRRGFTLGKPENFCNVGRQKGTDMTRQAARNHPANLQATELIRLYQRDQLTTRAIAQKLNDNGFRTRRGKLFGSETVRRLVQKETSAQ